MIQRWRASWGDAEGRRREMVFDSLSLSAFSPGRAKPILPYNAELETHEKAAQIIATRKSLPDPASDAILAMVLFEGG